MKGLTFFKSFSFKNKFRLNRVAGVNRIHLALDLVQGQDTCICDNESLGYKRLSQVAKQLSASGGLLHGVCTLVTAQLYTYLPDGVTTFAKNMEIAINRTSGNCN